MTDISSPANSGASAGQPLGGELSLEGRVVALEQALRGAWGNVAELQASVERLMLMVAEGIASRQPLAISTIDLTGREKIRLGRDGEIVPDGSVPASGGRMQ